MRRIRKNLIQKGPAPRVDAPLAEALAAREANVLGDNGPSHGQDRYLARANAGDLVVPLDELSDESRAELEEAVGGFDGRIIGSGGELEISTEFTDGVGPGDPTDTAAISVFLVKNSFWGEGSGDAGIQAQVEHYFDNRPRFQIFIHNTKSVLDGVVFVRIVDHLQSGQSVAIQLGPFLSKQEPLPHVNRKLRQAAQTWALSLNISIFELHQVDDSEE